MCLSQISRNWKAYACKDLNTSNEAKKSKKAKAKQWRAILKQLNQQVVFYSEDKLFRHKLRLNEKWEVGKCKLHCLLSMPTVLQPSMTCVTTDIWFPTDTSKNIWISFFNTASFFGLPNQPVLRITPLYAWTEWKFRVSRKVDSVQGQLWIQECPTHHVFSRLHTKG